MIYIARKILKLNAVFNIVWLSLIFFLDTSIQAILSDFCTVGNNISFPSQNPKILNEAKNKIHPPPQTETMSIIVYLLIPLPPCAITLSFKNNINRITVWVKHFSIWIAVESVS